MALINRHKPLQPPNRFEHRAIDGVNPKQWVNYEAHPPWRRASQLKFGDCLPT